VVSSKGNKYSMILYDCDSNAILAQPIKDRTAPELLKFTSYGTGIGVQRPKTKAHET
jgi:hypothetical protein